MESFNELLQQADNGDLSSQEKVATAFFKGNGVEKDINKAISYFLKAAENGSGMGNYQMGRAYETGTGASMDIQKAKIYYKKSAELGYQNAVNKLQSMETNNSIEQTTGNVYVPPASPNNTYVPPQAPNANNNQYNQQQALVAQKSKVTACLLYTSIFPTFADFKTFPIVANFE